MDKIERFIYTKIDGYYWIKDTETNENYCANKTIVKLLNQLDARIKELEKENQQLKDQVKKSYQEGLLQKQFDKDMEIQELKDKIKQLKQSQRMLAVDELIKLRKRFFDLFLLPTFNSLSPIIDEQIKKLMGEVKWRINI